MNIVQYILPFLGYNKNIKFTDVEEYFFIVFKHLLYLKSNYFALSWFLLSLEQRKSVLPLLIRGIRYIKNLPSRGQRTHSNYRTAHNNKKVHYNVFIKKLNKRYIATNFPS